MKNKTDNSMMINDGGRSDFLNHVELLQRAVENSGSLWHFHMVIILTFSVFLFKSL